MTIVGYDIFLELSRNERYILHRGRCWADGRPVLLKLPLHDPPRAAEVELLEREYQRLRELSVPGLVRAEELVRHGGSCCLVLEDQGGISLEALLASQPPDLALFFKVAMQLVTTLAELHRRGLTHRSLNPRSLLVHPATGEVSLVDLSLAARVDEPFSPFSVAHLSLDTLAYISPEQTGRMNRATDYRADFYSLGVIFYQLLTGYLPFRLGNSADPLELIHAHIARTPVPPTKLNPAIPEPLSELIMRLLAKTAEQRYQSARGLHTDLEICAREWAASGSVTPFPLGQDDVSDRFLIPQKLYGRDGEVEALLRAFDHVCEGPTTLTLVAGYSGIGKTSLIQELWKPIVRQRGYFIAGKFDQVARNVPFGALIQAFRGLVQQLLTESEDRLTFWRTRLSTVLGTNGGVITEVMPELELILGKQPPAPTSGFPATRMWPRHSRARSCACRLCSRGNSKVSSTSKTTSRPTPLPPTGLRSCTSWRRGPQSL